MVIDMRTVCMCAFVHAGPTGLASTNAPVWPLHVPQLLPTRANASWLRLTPSVCTIICWEGFIQGHSKPHMLLYNGVVLHMCAVHMAVIMQAMLIILLKM